MNRTPVQGLVWTVKQAVRSQVRAAKTGRMAPLEMMVARCSGTFGTLRANNSFESVAYFVLRLMD